VLSNFGFSLFGLYWSWVYLRHVQPTQGEGDHGGVGDDSPRLDLVLFFPPIVQPFLTPALNSAHAAMCGRRARRIADQYGHGSLHPGLGSQSISKAPRAGVTTDDLEEAQRRYGLGRFPNPASLFYLSAGDCCPYIAIYRTDTFRVTISGANAARRRWRSGWR
jgi:hypothetical protein